MSEFLKLIDQLESTRSMKIAGQQEFGFGKCASSAFSRPVLFQTHHTALIQLAKWMTHTPPVNALHHFKGLPQVES